MVQPTGPRVLRASAELTRGRRLGDAEHTTERIRSRTAAASAIFATAVREIEEVVPVNVSTRVLPSGVMVGR
jgi:hypothetical protein